MKRKLLVVSLFAALLVGVVSPAAVGTVNAASYQQTHQQSHQQSHPAFFDKTRFLAHLGLAYFAFHHFVYNPYKAGAFKKGANHRTRSIIKAGVALLFTYHEIKRAYDIATNSNSATLHALVKPLSGLVRAANRVANQLRGGQYNDAEVKGIIGSANGFSRQATHNGFSIKDIPVPGL